MTVGEDRKTRCPIAEPIRHDSRRRRFDFGRGRVDRHRVEVCEFRFLAREERDQAGDSQECQIQADRARAVFLGEPRRCERGESRARIEAKL